jgi:hypothetical protein
MVNTIAVVQGIPKAVTAIGYMAAKLKLMDMPTAIANTRIVTTLYLQGPNKTLVVATVLNELTTS